MKVRVGLLLAALAVMAIVAIAFAATLASPPPGSAAEVLVAVARAAGVSPEPALFRLAGRVRADDGAPIADALACDHPAFAAPTSCARSAPDGSFALSVAAGFHKLEVAPPPGSTYVGAWYDDRDRSRDADLLDLRAGDRTDLVVRLVSGHRVSGRVVGPNGAPVADAQACADPTETPAEWTCARTDADGRYVAVVPAGEYLMFFVPPEDTRLLPRWWRGGDQVLAADTLAVRGDVSGIDLALPPGLLVYGRLTSTSGKPVENALVCVDTRFPTGRICRPTDKGGNYSVAVRRGRFIVQFRPSAASGVVAAWYQGTADPRAADDVVVAGTDVRIDATLHAGKLLWGSVRGADGHPLEGATLNVYDADRACCAFVTGGAAGASGDYAIVVPTGRFWLEAYPPFGAPYVGAFYGGASRREIDVRERDSDVLADVVLENVP